MYNSGTGTDIRQWSTPYVVADVRPYPLGSSSPTGVAVRMFHSSDVTLGAGGLFDVGSATPFAQTVVTSSVGTVLDPSAPGSTIAGQAIQVQASGSAIASRNWQFTRVGGNWALQRGLQGGGTSAKSVYTHVVTTDVPTQDRIVLRQTYDADTQSIVERSVDRWRTFAWGQERIEHRHGPVGNERVEKWSYYDNAQTDTVNYGRVRLHVHPDSGWTHFQYDASGRPITIISQFKSNLGENQPIAVLEAQNWVTQRLYSQVNIDGDSVPEEVEETVRRLQGLVVSRSFAILFSDTGFARVPQAGGGGRRWSINLAAPNSVADVPAYLTALASMTSWAGQNDRISETITQASSPYRVLSTLSSTGACSWRSYGSAAGVFERVTSYSGHFSPAATNSLRDYTIYTTDRNERGTTLSAKTVQVTPTGTEVVTSHMAVPGGTATPPQNIDVFGRALAMQDQLTDLTRTMTYGCCGVDSETDPLSGTTRYVYDELGRRTIAEKQVNATDWLGSRVAYDAADRVVTTWRRSTQGTSAPFEQLESRAGFDSAGRMLWSRNALNTSADQTDYEYGEVPFAGAPGQTVRVETRRLPSPGLDGQGQPLPRPEAVRYVYMDGSTHSVIGTAVRPTMHDHGVTPVQGASGYGMVYSVRFGNQANNWSQWVREYSDSLGRTVLIEKPTEGSAIAQEVFEHFAQGRRQQHTDADGVRSISASGVGQDDAVAVLGSAPPAGIDLSGRWSISVQDVDADGVIDWNAGLDRITINRSFPSVMQIGGAPGIEGQESVQVEIAENPNDPETFRVLEVARSKAAATGFRSEQIERGRVSRSLVVPNTTAKTVVTTTTAPTGAMSISTNVYGRTTRSEQRLAPKPPNTIGDWAGAAVPEYDQWGRTIKSHFLRTEVATLNGPDDDVTETAFDVLDRPYQRIEPAADPVNAPTLRRTTVIAYDRLGRSISETNIAPTGPAFNTTTTYTYWPTGEIKSVRGAGANPVDYYYDDLGRMTDLVTYQDAANTGSTAVTNWLYHPQTGRLLAKQYHGGDQEQYTYSPAGRLAGKTNARGIGTTYTYGTTALPSSGRLSKIDYADATPDVSFTHDRRGRVNKIVDASGTRTLTLADDGRATDEEITAGVLAGVRTSSTFTPIAGTTFSTVRTAHDVRVGTSIKSSVRFGYDDDERVNRVFKSGVLGDLNAGADVQYTFDPLHGQVLTSTSRKLVSGSGLGGTFADRLSGVRSYDRLGRLTAIEWSQQPVTVVVARDEYQVRLGSAAASNV
ncbi:hypothetical protein HCU40_25680 [Pseudanabaena biceps]|nr:hypothetical protein [Pseudanabaena biceps]